MKSPRSTSSKRHLNNSGSNKAPSNPFQKQGDHTYFNAPRKIPGLGKKSQKYRTIHEFLVEKENNSLAYKIAQKVIQTANTNYNPIYLFGTTGTGKTHLLEAITRGLKANFTEYQVMFLRADEYYQYFLYALKHNQWNSFRQSCSESKVFLLDDIHLLQKKKQTQQQLLFMMDELINRGALVIISSQRRFQDLENFEPALLNRLQSGLPVKIKTISSQAVLEHCEKIAKRLSTPISPDMIEILWEQYEGSFGEFKDRFERLLIFCQESKQSITMPLLRNFVTKLKTSKKTLSQEAILEKVAQHFSLSGPECLFEKGSKRSLSEARYVAISLMKDMLSLKNHQLQEIFGQRSESTIRYALKKNKESKDLQNRYWEIKEVLKNDFS